MTAVNTDVLKKDAEAIAEALERHNIFGLERDSLTLQARELFVDLVLRQATDPAIDSNFPLAIEVKESGARIEVSTKVIADTALFATLKVVPVPNPVLDRDPEVDYESLASEIDFIREWLEVL